MPTDEERPQPHEHDWTASTQPGPWPNMPGSTCLAPDCPGQERPQPGQWGREAAEWHRYLHQEGMLVEDEGEDCGPWHHRVFLGKSAPASRERPSIDVERLADATEIAAMALHRWKHPSFDLGEYRCRCRDDAEMAVRLLSPHNREAGE